MAGRAPSRTAPELAGSAAIRLPALALAGTLVLAGALRFATLDVQSFWLDESFTLALVRRPLGDMLATLPNSEGTPPLYFIVAWLWTRVFGSGEAGLRSLSALAGTATVPLAFLAGRELVSRRAGLVAAALAALNPWLVWYSQEARAYALLVALSTAGLVFFARVLKASSPRAGDLALWAGASILVLTTQYAGVFVVLTEAAWLLAVALARRQARRATLAAVGALAAGGLALIPLALEQRSEGGEAVGGGDVALATQAKQLVKQLFNSELGGAFDGQALVAVLVALVAAWLLLARGDRRERRGALVAGALAAASATLPLALLNPFLLRYAIPAAVPVLIAAAAGYGAARAGRVGLAAAAVLCGIWLATDIRVPLDRGLQRDDWRGAVAALGPVREPRVVVVAHKYEELALEAYLPVPAALEASGLDVREVDVVRLARGGKRPPPLRFSGFTLAARRRTTSYELLRFRSPAPTRVSPATFAPVARAPGMLVQAP